MLAMDKTERPNKIIGILALQGDYEAHRRMLEDRVGAKTAFVRTPAELAHVDALILPGGESTTIAKLMERNGLDRAIQARAQMGMPIYGTCAGLILLAKDIEDRPDQPTLKLMDVRVARNAFGRQIESFEADIPFTLPHAAGTDAAPIHGIFIRAPYVTKTAPNVEVLGRFQEKIVGVRQGSLLGTAFHPELTDDARVHAYFAQIVAESQEKRSC
jgi:5'-phosphate synthase pdxT subunit